jgi:D-aminopeptidase
MFAAGTGEIIDSGSRRQSLKNIKDHTPYTVTAPIRLDVMFASSGQAKMAAVMPGMKQTDDRTVTYATERMRISHAIASAPLSP